jgi:alpha-tubulin suppressor-like RCC1 family protein
MLHARLPTRAAAFVLLLGGCDSSPTPPPAPPAAVVIVSGNEQLGTVVTALPQPLVVRVVDADGQPLPGVSVTWAAGAESGAVSPATTMTDASGVARADWTLGTKAKVVSASATVAGLAPATFSAQAAPGPAAALTVTPDSLWLTGPGDTIRLRARAVDAYQNVIANPAVQWESSAPALASVDGAGLVRGEQIGAVLITARLGTLMDQAKAFVPGPFGALAAGYTHACAVLIDGRAYCWGANDTGNLGTGTTTPSLVPVAVSGGHRFTRLAAGMQSTCGIASGGATYCWGYNGSGSLGNGSTADSYTPTAVASGQQFTKISTGPGAGSTHVCALTAAGTAYCWGENVSGQVGDGSTETRTTPWAVSGSLVFSELAAGDNHTCALTPTGQAYCWGNNSSGQVGQVDAGAICGFGGITWNCSLVPVAVSGGLQFSTISAGGGFTCGVTVAGDGYCWGEGNDGQLGNGGTTGSAVPVRVSTTERLAAIMAGYPGHACALTTSGAALCWGRNGTGELGNGSTADSPIPVAVSGGLQFQSLVAGGQFSCGVTLLREAFCWGAGGSGALGSGGSGNSFVPVRVAIPGS